MFKKILIDPANFPTQYYTNSEKRSRSFDRANPFRFHFLRAIAARGEGDERGIRPRQEGRERHAVNLRAEPD